MIKLYIQPIIHLWLTALKGIRQMLMQALHLAQLPVETNAIKTPHPCN